MTNLSPITINNVEVSPIVFSDVPVITLAMVDKVHGRPEGTARKRFYDNKSRLIEGEDYFHVTRENPMSVLRTLDEIRTLGIPPKGIILLTESGYLLLVKTFQDDLAWQVQRQLVKGYFKAIGRGNIHIGTETLTPSEQQTLSEIAHRRAEAYGELQGKVLAQIWSRVHRKFRVSKYSLLPRTQLADAILYVTQMNIRLGKANVLPEAKRYHYPRQLLEQPHFTTSKIPAALSVSMLADTTEFVSPLFALLNEMRTDGHDIGAPWDEAVAMREGLQQVDQAMEKAIHCLWASRFAPASTSEN